MLARFIRAVAPVCALGLACTGHAATITPLQSLDEFVSPLVITNDFENGVNVSGITFGSSASVMPAIRYSRNVTTSGFMGLVENRGQEPMTAYLDAQAVEVGLYFGNDDFNLLFDATLSVFDAAGSVIGSVSVTSNGNDFVDQFIGLRSDTAFSSVGFAYARPAAQGLDLFIDDFSIGIGKPTVIGEPSVHWLLMPALAGLALGGRRQRR